MHRRRPTVFLLLMAIVVISSSSEPVEQSDEGLVFSIKVSQASQGLINSDLPLSQFISTFVLRQSSEYLNKSQLPLGLPLISELASR